MTTVRRDFVSTPQRDAGDTWRAIVDLLTKGATSSARDELLSVHGIATSIIADQAAKDAAIVVTCDGPRTRIYCLYDDKAVEGDDTNEESLGFDPLNGGWMVSLPCDPDDLAWVQAGLAAKSKRITARDKAAAFEIGEETQAAGASGLAIDPKGFLGA